MSTRSCSASDRLTSHSSPSLMRLALERDRHQQTVGGIPIEGSRVDFLFLSRRLLSFGSDAYRKVLLWVASRSPPIKRSGWWRLAGAGSSGRPGAPDLRRSRRAPRPRGAAGGVAYRMELVTSRAARTLADLGGCGDRRSPLCASPT